MKRIGLLLILALLVAVPVFAQEAAEIELFFHSGRGEERDALNAILVNFNESQSDYVAVAKELPEGSYTDAVNAAALANELPCLLDFDGPTLYSFAYRGYMLPIDDYVSDELKADILPSIIEQGTYNGKLYSLGVFESGLAIWGNKQYLETAGVRIPTIDTPWTLDEFNAALEALSQVEGVEYALDLKMNYGQGEWFTYGFSPILQSFGGDLINREDYQSAEGVLNGDAGVAFGEWFQSLFTNGYTTATPPDDNLFIDGKAALSFVGHWEFNRYSAALGDNLVLIPMPDFGSGPATGNGSWNWGITTQCANPDGAWALLEFMLQPDQMTIMTKAAGTIPSRISVLEQDARFAEGGPMNVYFQQLFGGVAVPRPQTPAYPVITAEFAKAIDEIAKGGDVQAALDAAVDAIERNIEENNGYQAQ
ncbi:MAG: sugar ABC transporter substrate-binding protein [Chloroflexi bacterium]|nr:sugar ABC transporter substrate-binding protein [Chloroflexota bacterium]MDL1882862.1 sugar ABC transporter substrate-binding protein [Anaerolineae bacterium CFX8]